MKFKKFSDQWSLAIDRTRKDWLPDATEYTEARAKEAATRYDSHMFGGDPKRGERVAELLAGKGVLRRSDIALDAGCGSGINALPLARRCERVVALDVSPPMLAATREKAVLAKIANIDCVNSSWQDFYEEHMSTGSQRNFDLVLASLNHGMYDGESLLQMNAVSCRHCVFVAPCTDFTQGEHAARLNRLILESNPCRSGNDVIHAFTLLYECGFSPSLDYIDTAWEWSADFDDAVSALEYRYRAYKRSYSARDRQTLENYVRSHLQDGQLRERKSFRLGVVCWNACDEMTQHR
jgi:SAM-dependent methyltransferase